MTIRRPVIVHLTTVPVSLERLLKPEIIDLVSRGAAVHTICGPKLDSEPWRPVEGVIHHVAPSLTRKMAPMADLRAIAEIWQILRTIRPDVLHTHTPKAAIYGRIIGRALGVTVVANTVHGLPVRESPRSLFENGYLLFESLAGLFSDVEFYLTEGDLELVGRWHRSHNFVTGGGIDLQRFAFDPEMRARRRAELGLGDDEILIGGVGRRVADKGIVEFAQAAEQLGGRATFVWIGPDDPEKKDAISTQLSHVRFLDFSPVMQEWYSAFDIFVLPSFREGLPKSAMEASAIGLPIVTTAIRGTTGLGRDEVELRRFPVGDVTALVNVLGDLIEHPELRRELGLAARQRALEHYNIQRISAIYAQAYVDIALAKGRPISLKGVNS